MSTAGTVQQADAKARTAGLRVRRAWPRGPGHLQLELAPATAAPGAAPVAAQWFDDTGRARQVWRGTREAVARLTATIVSTAPGTLQAAGWPRSTASQPVACGFTNV